jgi:hypothetical protein
MATKLLYLKGSALILKALIGLIKEHAVFIDLPFVFDWSRRFFGQRINVR